MEVSGWSLFVNTLREYGGKLMIYVCKSSNIELEIELLCLSSLQYEDRIPMFCTKRIKNNHSFFIVSWSALVFR